MAKQISIIIATYNASKTLRRCLESIVSQMTEECELLVIDGGSTDGTQDIIQEFSNHVAYTISEKDKGIYDAWNKGIRATKGEWIMFIGADDVLLDGAIDSYLKRVKEYPATDYDFISSKIESVTQTGKFLQYTGRLWNYERCRINMDVTHVASLTSRYYFEKVGLFNIEYKICGDYELLMRGRESLRAVFNDFVVARMPIGGASFSIEALLEQNRIKRRIGNVSLLKSFFILIIQIFFLYTYTIRHSK